MSPYDLWIEQHEKTCWVAHFEGQLPDFADCRWISKPFKTREEAVQAIQQFCVAAGVDDPAWLREQAAAR